MVVGEELIILTEIDAPGCAEKSPIALMRSHASVVIKIGINEMETVACEVCWLIKRYVALAYGLYIRLARVETAWIAEIEAVEVAYGKRTRSTCMD